MNKSKILTIVCNIAFLLYFVPIIFFIGCIFIKGYKCLSIDLLTNKNQVENISVEFKESEFKKSFFKNTQKVSYFSKNFGFELILNKDFKLEKKFKVQFIDPESKLYIYKNEIKNLVLVSAITKGEKNQLITIFDSDIENFIKKLDESNEIISLQFETIAGGIRGSVLTTFILCLIVTTLSVTISLLSSIGLRFYIKDTIIYSLFNQAMNILTSIPSIIYGLFGIGWISLKIDSGEDVSLITASLVLFLMIFPYLVKNFISAINQIEAEFIEQIISLGVKKHQMIFKCIIKKLKRQVVFNSLFSVTKVIGESAALFFVLGLTIEDNISIKKSSTTLALHIYALLSEDNPNYNLVCAIAIILMIFIFIINKGLKVMEEKDGTNN